MFSSHQPDERAAAKLVQYLGEAHATENALIRTLQAHIDITPRGEYRELLERHLAETKGHAERVRARLLALAGAGDLLKLGVELATGAAGRVMALAKAPLDLIRGSGGEEKLLKNAKDECVSETLEMATYLVLEQLARAAGDPGTATMAAEIRADEERMLAALFEQLPALTGAMTSAELAGRPSYDASETGAADSAREMTRRAAPGPRAPARRRSTAGGRRATTKRSAARKPAERKRAPTPRRRTA